MFSLIALISTDYISAEQISDNQTQYNRSPYSFVSSAGSKNMTYINQSPSYLSGTTQKVNGIQGEALLVDRSLNGDQIAHPISVYQRIDKESVSPGGTVNYTIIYSNNLATKAENVMVTDFLPEMKYYTAEPSPTYTSGNVLIWILGDLLPGEIGSIELTVDLNEKGSEFVFKESQSISGTGFVRVHHSVSTPSDYHNRTFTSYVNITADYQGKEERSSDTYSIELMNGIKPEFRVLEHGSGTYNREDKTEIDTKKGNGRTDNDLLASYGQESFALPANRSIDFNSKWSESVYNKDKLTGFSSYEKYMYAKNIDRQSRFKVSDEESNVKFDTKFEGAASIKMRVGPNEGSTELSGEAYSRSTPGITSKRLGANYESEEDYLGNFSLSEKIDSGGYNSQKRINSFRVASGNGSVAVDKRVGDSQRSYESGTGNYQVEDIIKSGENSIVKDITVEKNSTNFTYTPDFNVSLFRSWEEGLISNSASRRTNSHITSSLIIEKYSNIDYLKKSSEAKGLNEMNTTSDFLGRSEFKAQARISNPSGSIGQTNILQDYSGRFNLTRDIEIRGAPHFDRPHLSISKTGKADLANNTFVDYTIQVTNDGDSVLTHVNIQDFLPPGTSYVHSSLKPRMIGSTYINWTVPVSLKVGESYHIDLKLSIAEKVAYLINQAYAYAVYDDLLVKSKCISELELNWPESSSLPSPTISMTALIDGSDPMMIRYRAILENRGKASITANSFCTLPDELEFLDSSVRPKSNTSTEISWNPIILRPGENKTIEFRARASQNGTYINKFTLKVIGQRSLTVKVAIAVAHVNDNAKVGGEQVDGAQGNNSQANDPQTSDWQPPSCFGLNCTQETDSESDWYSCFDLDANELIDSNNLGGGDLCETCF